MKSEIEKANIGDAVIFEFVESTLVGVVTNVSDKYLDLYVKDAGFDNDEHSIHQSDVIQIYRKGEHDIDAIEHPDNWAIWR